ncbi:hypothetical protein [uncultured Pseudokineococcus sp.]|uniref:hypothetical protein n=1 Tax=uncultured Pseudokineococcus sp. TaxID=1642928 RepID=UPI00263561FB|nr:hypothetical protein [uncultured Pseudokineococcus sp.]
MLRISPGLRRCWRGLDRLQLGLDPAHAVVLEGLSAGEEALLEDLADGLPESGLPARAAARGVSGADAARLVGLLATAGVLEHPAAPGSRAAARATAAEAGALALVHGRSGWDVLAGRARRVVAVEGGGRVADAVAAGLREAGTGDVAVLGPGAAPRGAGTGPPPPGHVAGVDLVVLVADAVVAPARAARLVRADVDHLPVVVRERSAVVGPLVVPGAGACLRCVELHRADRDPEWPLVAAQLASPATTAAPDVVLLRLTSALAVAQALAHLDDATGATPGGASWEVRLPDGVPLGRAWAPHPSCGCTWPPL